MSRIREKISKLVSGQLPEFIQNNYTTFVKFVEYYYEFLEQDQHALEIVQNARSYSDIDRTTLDFVQYFLKNYQQDIPLSQLSNKKLLIKRINDLYSAKGSSLSFKLLFRILYDEPVEVARPYENVLRPSDGQWEQRVSLRVRLDSGSVNDILGRFLTYTKNGITYEDPIVRVRTLDSSLDVYEIFLKSTSNVPYTTGDSVLVSNGITNIFVGVIRPTLTNYSIVTSGSGFKVGQIFNVNVSGGRDTLARIIKVNSSGGIELLKILNYGFNYTGDITVQVYNDLSVATRTVSFSTNTGGTSESFFMTAPHTGGFAGRYFESDYVATEYTGTQLARVISSNTTTSQTNETSALDESVAVVTFTSGAIARYPGQYISTRGFLDEPEVRIQDPFLYQPFAYELQSEVDINLFYDTVQKLVHPAGQSLFNNRTVTVFANVVANVNVETFHNVIIQLNSVFTSSDYVVAALNRLLDTDTANITDVSSISLIKGFSNSASTSDSINLQVGQVFEDSESIEDSNVIVTFSKIIDDTANVLDNFGRVANYNRTFSDNAIISDELIKTVSFNLTDNVNTSDAIVVGLGLPPIYDNTNTIVDITVLSTNKNINNTQDNATVLETFTATKTSYAQSGYFAELYEGTTITV